MGNALGRVFSSITTGEQIAQPEYKGTGYVVLEPSFKHFLLLNLDNEDIIVDKGMFYCAQKKCKSIFYFPKKYFIGTSRRRRDFSNTFAGQWVSCIRMCCS